MPSDIDETFVGFTPEQQDRWRKWAEDLRAHNVEPVLVVVCDLETGDPAIVMPTGDRNPVNPVAIADALDHVARTLREAAGG